MKSLCFSPHAFFRSGALLLLTGAVASATLVTDPNDARVWQGATVSTFAQLYYGGTTLAHRQQVITNQLLDDGLFSFTGATAATLLPGSTFLGSNIGGKSLDATGTGSFGYTYPFTDGFTAGNAIDDLWVQTSGTVGATVWNLHTPSTKAAIFNTIDHGPLPQEAIESTVYLSNGGVGASTSWTWTQAVVEKVWLEGFHPILGVKWDGFAFAVGTGTNATFQYASIIHGGPGALINDGDDEINGVLGLNSNFTPSTVPEAGSTLILTGIALLSLGGWSNLSRRRSRI